MKSLGYYLCKYLHWHKPDGLYAGGFGRIVSKCQFCGKDVQLDSQGNWY